MQPLTISQVCARGSLSSWEAVWSHSECWRQSKYPYYMTRMLANGIVLQRRSGRRPPAPTIPAVRSKELASSTSQETNQPSTKFTQSSDRPSSSGKAGRASPQPDSKPSSKPASLKREQSDIFKSFSKPKAKSKRQDPGGFTGASPAPSAAQPVRVHSLFLQIIISNNGRTRKPFTKMVRVSLLFITNHANI